MRTDRHIRISTMGFLLAASLAAVAPRHLPAQVMFFDSAQPIKLEEEIARYLPGVSFFQKGLEAYRKGQSAAAIDAPSFSVGATMATRVIGARCGQAARWASARSTNC